MKSTEKPKQIKKVPLLKKRKYASKLKDDGKPLEPSNGDNGSGGASATVVV